MELIKKSINFCRKKNQISTQVVVNEDLNLPDYMEDIEKIILENGEFILEKIKVMNDNAVIYGCVKYHLLYEGGQTEGNISAFVRETPIEEKVHIDGVDEHDEVSVDASLDNFNINIINSRKINGKMIIDFNITVNEFQTEEVTLDTHMVQGLEKKYSNCRLLQLKVNSNDIFRFHNQQDIPSDKPNIGNVMYENIVPREIQLRVEDGYVSVDGRIHVFVLYMPEGTGGQPQWMEYDFPVNGKIECAQAFQGMIGDLKWNLSSKELEIKEDNENEPRVISISGVLDIGINIYEEEELRLLDDIYGINQKMLLNSRQVLFPKLLMKNSSVCRLVKRMKVTDGNLPITEVCNIEGDVKTELVFAEENMLAVDGHVFIKLLYVTNEEKHPFKVAGGTIPFSHNIEIPGLNSLKNYRIRPLIESLSATMEGTNEVEIHVQIVMDVLVFDWEPLQVVDEITVSDIPKEELQNMPGMIGYIAGEGDNLWEIAKKYHTTEDAIISVNRLKDDALKTGQKLLIIKNMAKA